MKLGEIIKSLPSDPLHYGGRAGRKETVVKILFWTFAPIILVFVLALEVTVSFLSAYLGISIPTDVLFVIAALCPFLGLIPVATRRLRDSGISGWVYPIFLALCAGIALIFIEPIIFAALSAALGHLLVVIPRPRRGEADVPSIDDL